MQQLHVLSAQNEVPESLIQESLELLVNTEVADFAVNLGMARAIFRDYPELVTAESFPEQILLSLTKPNQSCGELDAEDCLDHVFGYNGEPFVTEEMKERLAPLAREIATSCLGRIREKAEAAAEMERCERAALARERRV